jgi:hypothetical protein
MKFSKVIPVTVCAVVAACFSFSVKANQYEFIAADSSLETKTCIAAVKDDVWNHRKTVKQFSHQRPDVSMQRVIVNKLRCNDMNIVQFASLYGAYDTAAYMSQYLKTKVTIRRDLAHHKSSKQGKTVIRVSAK